MVAGEPIRQLKLIILIGLIRITSRVTMSRTIDTQSSSIRWASTIKVMWTLLGFAEKRQSSSGILRSGEKEDSCRDL